MDIEKLAKKPPNVFYEPEQFPGAICYAKELEGMSIMIFAHGKIVATGLKSRNLLEAGKRALADLARDLRH